MAELHSELTSVAYVNDEGFHLGMTEFAAARLRAGHNPLTSWYPLLNLGSPEFLHYQSLSSILTGAVGIATGTKTAFAWSTWILLSTWPISVYFGARLLGWGPWTAASSALVAPLISSAAGVGYEWESYIWIGYGVWTQLWAMWTIPLAIGCSWRTITEGRYLLPAVVFLAATAAFHFETAYIAAVPLVVMVFTGGSWARVRTRARRAVVLGVLSLLAASWVIVPLVVERKFAAVNEFLAHSSDVNSFGARRILSWLVSGRLFDSDRLPVLSVALGIGLCIAIARFVRDERYRLLLVLFVIYLVMFFGRTTFGTLWDIVPGAKDLFLRRLVAGVELTGLWLIGASIAALARLAGRLGQGVGASITSLRLREISGRVTSRTGLALLGSLVVVGLLAPAWTQIASHMSLDTHDIAYQHGIDTTAPGQEMDALIARAQSIGGGRIFGGLPTGFGSSFTVGGVPVFEYLANQGVDSIGFTLRTASLMSDAEPYFDDTDPGDYSLFGVRFLILPETMPPPVPATRIDVQGPYALWEIAANGYVQIVNTVGTIDESRFDIGATNAGWLATPAPSEDSYLSVAYGGSKAAAPTDPGATNAGAPGVVVSTRPDLSNGETTATVVATRRSVVVLSASYDPGWHVTVDGRAAKVAMIAPALPGVVVGTGEHVVVFSYDGFGAYDELFVLSALALVAAALIARRRWLCPA